MPLNSLSFRLISGAALWAIVALVAAGLILTSLYRATVERAFDQRLSVYLKTLVGVMATQRPPVSENPGNLNEPRFGLTLSGWYWQVKADDVPVMTSASLLTDEIFFDATTAVESEESTFHAAQEGPNGEGLRVIARYIQFESVDGNVGANYEFLVAGDADELADEIAQFRNNVILTLAVFGFGLIVSTFFQIRWGIRPLGRVSRGLADLRSGKETRFEGPFPTEIEPLARELNALLKSNQEIIERARTQVGNLAHALKTPLSVTTNEARANQSPLASKVAEQAELMRMQVSTYLDRARIAARSTVIGAITPVEPVISRLTRAMNKIYEDKGVILTAHIYKGALFKGEQQDLEEIVGNLADNACKWAKEDVSVTVAYDRPLANEEHGKLTIHVDDDGPGLTEEQRKEATGRGKRLDESKPGSGLGLSIVTDLVQMYGGSFRLDSSPVGGLRAEVVLPAA